MQWCRLYHEFATDPKVQMMPEAMQRRLIMLFCFQADGSLETMDEETLAFALHIDAAELKKTRELFVKKGFVGKDSWMPRNWDKRQMASDNVNERVKRYRERNERSNNDSVTLQKRRTPVACNGPEAEAEAELDTEAAGRSASACTCEADSAAAEPAEPAAAAEFSSHAEENAADWREAMNVLRAQSKTAALAAMIEASRDPRLKKLDGWRALVASHHIQRPGKTIPGTIAGFLKYAAQANAGDLDAIENPRKKPEPATNGAGNGEYVPTLSQRIEAEEKAKPPPDAAELAWLRNRFKELKARDHLNVADAAEFKSIGAELAKHKKGAKP